tara:strand:- start:2215 stop:2496 length:282 start_codon:yes stop_codon:yes gene_type:complete
MDKKDDYLQRMILDTEQCAKNALAKISDSNGMLPTLYGLIAREIITQVRDMEIDDDLKAKIMYPLTLVLEREFLIHETAVAMAKETGAEMVKH